MRHHCRTAPMLPPPPPVIRRPHLIESTRDWLDSLTTTEATEDQHSTMPAVFVLDLARIELHNLKVVYICSHRFQVTVRMAESAWDIPYLNRKIFLFGYQILKSYFFLSSTFPISLSDFYLIALL